MAGWMNPRSTDRRFAITWLLVLLSTSAAWASDPYADEPDEPLGSLMIMGGSERFEHREFWDETVKLAGGPGARIAVFPTASLDPIRRGQGIIAALNRSGAEAFLVPLAWRWMPSEPADVVQDAEIIDQVRQADGVFFVGGGQERITRALLPGGQSTPLLEAVWDVYRQGGVIAGTSAGAAIMSRIMYRTPDSVLETLEQGVRLGQEVDAGLGFMPHDWFVDQHCLVRGRFARALVAMVDQGFTMGLGIDENSAVVLQRGRHLRVIGHRGALLLDLTQAEHDPTLGHFNIRNARLTFLDRGDRMDLATRQVFPAPSKLNDVQIDPNSDDFDPSIEKQLFFNDILANTTVVDLMIRLMDSRHAEAIGLAFDGAKAHRGVTDGFEFRFTRDSDSLAWYTESTGGDDYTILNIRLDVRPIRFPGRLYEYLDTVEEILPD